MTADLQTQPSTEVLYGFPEEEVQRRIKIVADMPDDSLKMTLCTFVLLENEIFRDLAIVALRRLYPWSHICKNNWWKAIMHIINCPGFDGNLHTIPADADITALSQYLPQILCYAEHVIDDSSYGKRGRNVHINNLRRPRIQITEKVAADHLGTGELHWTQQVYD